MSGGIRKQLHMNPYDYHKYLINEYVLKKPGDTKLIFKNDTSKYKTDKDVILENMKFIWNEEEIPSTWEERLAKKYYDKLFREYCICDLTRFKENKIANRFRIEKEVVVGKGQFICGEKGCTSQDNLRTWEVNFAYIESGEKKNALVKIRLCESCSEKLNYNSKKREIKRLKRQKSKIKNSSIDVKKPESTPSSVRDKSDKSPSTSRNLSDSNDDDDISEAHQVTEPINDERLWKANEPTTRGRDEEFDDYLTDLLL